MDRDSLVSAGFVAAWRAVRLLPEGTAHSAFRLAADRIHARNGRGVPQLRRMPPGEAREFTWVAAELAPELESMAGWLGVEAVTVGDRGDLVADLRAALHRSRGGGK